MLELSCGLIKSQDFIEKKIQLKDLFKNQNLIKGKNLVKSKYDIIIS